MHIYEYVYVGNARVLLCKSESSSPLPWFSSGAVEVREGTGGVLLLLEEEQALRGLHPAWQNRQEEDCPPTGPSVSEPRPPF